MFYMSSFINTKSLPGFSTNSSTAKSTNRIPPSTLLPEQPGKALRKRRSRPKRRNWNCFWRGARSLYLTDYHLINNRLAIALTNSLIKSCVIADCQFRVCYFIRGFVYFQPSVQTHQTMIIEEFEPDVFRQLIEYIHTGCVTLQARTLLGE